MRGLLFATALVLAVFCGIGCAALAQAQEGSKAFVHFDVGGNVERSEDGISGESVGGGLGVAARVTGNWFVQFETWIPAYYRYESVKHRDVLLAGTMMHRWPGGRVSPYLVVGAAWARVQEKADWWEDTNTGNDVFVEAGGGAQIRLTPRFAVAPNVRVDLGVGAAVIRPNVSFVIGF